MEQDSKKRQGIFQKLYVFFATLVLVMNTALSAVSVWAEDAAPAATNTLDVKLTYGDGQEHPDGQTYGTGDTMSAYIKVTPENLTTEPKEVDIKVTLPGKYLNSASIPSFDTASTKDVKVTKVGEDYQLNIKFTDYQKSEALTIPFIANWKSGFPPTNYKMDITGTVTIDGTTTNLNTITWKPQYTDYKLDKYINNNDMANMKDNYAEAMPGVITGEDGKNYLSESSSVPFAFVLSGIQAFYGGQYRQLEKVTITDTLPTYTDKNGATRTAVLDTEKSVGWTDNGDGTVSKSFEAKANNNGASYHQDFMIQIKENSFLYLKFPDLAMDKDQKVEDLLTKDLTNTASFVGVPKERGEGEPDITGEDSLIFRLTSKDLQGSGSFAKRSQGDIFDTLPYKTANYEWSLNFDNNTPLPFKNLVLSDTGLDSRLKISKIDMGRMMLGIYGNGPMISQYVDHLTLTLEDGTKKDVALETKQDGSVSMDLTQYGVVVAWDLTFKSDFELASGRGLRIRSYTVFKDPENTRVDTTNDSNNKYSNHGTMTFKTAAGASLKNDGDASFVMKPIAETVKINKRERYNSMNFTDGKHIQFMLDFSETVLDPAVDHGDLRLVDLYDPNTFEIDKSFMDLQIKERPWYKSYEIVENYHDSGRNALIIHLDQEALITELARTKGQAQLPFVQVWLKGTFEGGTYTNHVYVVGDNFAESSLKNAVEDSYDLNNNGSTTDKLAHSEVNYTIVAAEGIYARKYIAKNDDLSDASAVARTFKPGETFNYKLTIKNNTDTPVEEAVVYDVLPKVGDVNTLDSSNRMSEYTVSLRGPITAPAGWTVYYTTDASVTQSTMAEAADKDIWTTSVSDYSQVTGFKIVADNGTQIKARSEANFGVPVVNPSDYSDKVKELLLERSKDNADNAGQTGVVQAHNQFGYKAKYHNGNRESNTVTSQIFAAHFYVKKVDKDDRTKGLSGATFELSKDGTVIDTQTSNTDGTVAFQFLQEGTYTLKETKSPENYLLDETEHTVVVTYDTDNVRYHVTIDGEEVGSKASPKVIENQSDLQELVAEKKWDDADNKEGFRPESVQFQLYKNGQKEGDAVTVSAATNWQATFSKLPKTENGQTITYTVKEVTVPTGYTVDTEEASFVDGKATITNKRTPEMTEVTVKKVWDDQSNQDGLRPSAITLHLLANGEEVSSAEVSGSGDEWSYTFSDLAKYANGKEIVYTVTEDRVENYTTEINGMTITNHYKPGKTSMTVTKKWVDADDQDGIRPDSIKVQLYADGTATGQEVELSSSNNWTATFQDLDQKAAGKDIVYTVKEAEVPSGYEVTIDDNNKGNVLITNTHTTETTSVSVTKKWDDANNQDGLRPDKVTVALLADGVETGQTVELSSSNNWQATFTDLQKKAKGKDIVYTVQEVSVPEGYQASVDHTDPANQVITNTHTPKEPTPPTPEEPKKPKKIFGFLPNTGTTISLLGLIGAVMLGGLGYLTLRKKNKKQ
ncbi:Cna B-type domain-containing protein [Streptococcus sp. DD13]|uniref:Cna B-type domain-containing protein n=1 Tax=Streptococcus sp. DD13 TaxID=1777881 RepID=UPI000796923E|nr:Cna B-type domain-containing protein [Streptococcus sp. DD13]KXT77481.1 Collagen adhesin [Streptococcus sp. DD13]